MLDNNDPQVKEDVDGHVSLQTLGTQLRNICKNVCIQYVKMNKYGIILRYTVGYKNKCESIFIYYHCFNNIFSYYSWFSSNTGKH